jgi:hypothetical protein
VSAFNNAEVIKMLQTEFIPVAIDGGLMSRRRDPEGAFYRQFANTQARYAAAADGTSLAKKTWVPSPYLNKWMKDALAKFEKLPESSKRPSVASAVVEKRTSPVSPEGGLVLTVTSRFLKGHEVASVSNQRYAQLPAYDRVWLTRAEWQRLLPKGDAKSFELDASLVRKLARFHTIDVIGRQRGPWPEASVKGCRLTGKVLSKTNDTIDVQFSGSMAIKGASKPRPNLGPDDGDVKLDLKAAGALRYNKAQQQITQFDLVVYGPYLKDGRPSEIGFHFQLTGDESADEVPPWAVDRHHLYGDYPTYYTKSEK